MSDENNLNEKDNEVKAPNELVPPAENSGKSFCIHGKEKDPDGHKVTCEICLYMGIAEHYKKEYNKALEDTHEMRKLVNFYKTLMFTVDASKEQVTKNIETMSENFPFESSLLPMIPTWERLDPEIIYEAVRLHEMFYNKFAEIAFKTKSKVEIKAKLQKHTKDAMKAANDEVKELEVRREEKAKALTPFWKMVQSYKKTLNMTEAQAIETLRKAGITEESMKGKA